VAITGTGLGFGFASWGSQGAGFRAIGGGLAGGAIAGMHFAGMAAYRVDGIVTWRPAYVVASVLCSIAFASASLVVLGSNRRGTARLAIGAALLVAAIATLHFTAMTAMRISPVSLSANPLSSSGRQALGVATAAVGLLVIAAGVAAALIDRHTRSDVRERLHYMAMYDSLTSLPNRAHFKNELDRQFAIAREQRQQLGLIVIDLKRLKEINDVHGQRTGDEMLALLAGRMRTLLVGEEMAARHGGDEFVILTRHRHPSRLQALAHVLNESLRAPALVNGATLSVGASIGVASFPDDAYDVNSLTKNADLALYRAKNEGSLEPRFYEAALDEAVRARRELASDLRRAIEKNEMHLQYQVQRSINMRVVTGYEALLRWRHPLRGDIPPANFIPVAEDNGLILSLGEWVLRRACRDAMTWDHESRVAINVSPRQLAHAGLPDLFKAVLDETGLPPRRLEIELTESAIITDRANALDVLRRIKALGVSVALDDFGTGYSSLETLRAFRFDRIKLDRVFVSGLEDSPEGIAIVRAVLALARSLEIPVLAEGIERADQFEFLRREGCSEAQGFLLGRPESTPRGIAPAVSAATGDVVRA
jgi:diguanylate cyclase (GGDEF)-like protein